MQNQAIEQQFKQLGLKEQEIPTSPNKKMERWKYAPFNRFMNKSFKDFNLDNSKKDTDDQLKHIQDHFAGELTGNHLTFINGQISQALSDDSIFNMMMPSNISSDNLNQQSTSMIESHYFARFNTLVGINQHLIQLTGESKIKIIFISCDDDHPNDSSTEQYQQYALNIQIKSGAHIVLEEVHLSLGATQSYLETQLCFIHLAEQASCNHSIINRKQQVQLGLNCVYLSNDAKYNRESIELGASYLSNETHIFLQGHQSEANTLGLMLADQETIVENQLFLHHEHADTQSNTLYKGLISDKGRSIFRGAIQIASNCPKTEAHLLNNNLLLSDHAQAYTKPELDIDTDDVQCSHGATVGQLDDQSIFYLASRGIDKDEARKMLSYSFAEDVLSQFGNKELLNQHEQMIEDKLASLTQTNYYQNNHSIINEAE